MDMRRSSCWQKSSLADNIVRNSANGAGDGQVKISSGLAVSIGVAAFIAAICGTNPFVEGAWAQDKPIIVAQAQQDRPRFFNPFRPLLRLFENEHRRQRKLPERTTKRSPPRLQTAPPAFVEDPKDPDAGVILVVGDRMAHGVADGLRFTLANQPQVRVDEVTDEAGRFAGLDPKDWSALTLSRIRGADVKAVVVMIGQNDRGAPFPGDPPIEFATSEWFSAFEAQVTRLVRTIRQERLPVVWVGLPPTGSEQINSDFTALNALIQAQTQDSRVRFVDIWEIFLAEDGSFSPSGPDVDGKNTRLRTRDGIAFTWDGYRKVAFFVERELSRILGGYGGMAFEGVDDDVNFIVLTGRTSSPEAELLGDAQYTREIDTESEAYRFLVRGQSLDPVAGRVDNTSIAAGGGS